MATQNGRMSAGGSSVACGSGAAAEAWARSRSHAGACCSAATSGAHPSRWLEGAAAACIRRLIPPLEWTRARRRASEEARCSRRGLLTCGEGAAARSGWGGGLGRWGRDYVQEQQHDEQ
eukprot:366567-Chlamydomonas_euryale.AAC.7